MLIKIGSGHINSKIICIISALASEFIMVAGYFFFAAIVLGAGSGAISSIPGNIVQGMFAVITTPILYELLKKIRLSRI